MSDDREMRVRKRAHELWQQGGSPDGSDIEYWLQAEREVQQSDSVMEEDSPHAAAMREVERERPGAMLTKREKPARKRKSR